MLYIFDWDGTICDSAAKIVKCMQKAAEEVQVDVLDDDSIRNIIGLGLPEAIQALYPNISDKQRDNLRQSYADHFIADDQTPSNFFPGAMDTMQALLDQGNQLAVATGKSRKGLNRVWDSMGLEDFFHASRCADETASKPNPLMLEELLEEFSIGVSEAVMIGDTEYDMAMAHAIGMEKIAVSYGAHHISRLQTYEPALCVDHFTEILLWPERSE